MAVKKAEKKTDKKEEKKKKEIRQSAWEKYDKKALAACFELSETYRQFISDCKTERECVDESIRQAEKAGYKNLADFIGKKKKLKAGDKVYMSKYGQGNCTLCHRQEAYGRGTKHPLCPYRLT